MLFDLLCDKGIKRFDGVGELRDRSDRFLGLA